MCVHVGECCRPKVCCSDSSAKLINAVELRGLWRGYPTLRVCVCVRYSAKIPLCFSFSHTHTHIQVHKHLKHVWCTRKHTQASLCRVLTLPWPAMQPCCYLHHTAVCVCACTHVWVWFHLSNNVMWKLSKNDQIHEKRWGNQGAKYISLNIMRKVHALLWEEYFIVPLYFNASASVSVLLAL